MVDRWVKESGWALVDPKLEWLVTKESLLSQGKNTPLIHQKVVGKVIQTFTA